MTCVLCDGITFRIILTHRNGWKMGKCRSCGLVQAVPMLEKGQIDSLYHEDFDHFTPYIEQLSVHHRYFRQKLTELKRDLRGLRLLDIGCAMGVLLDEAKHKGM
jgi:hypothetical protein